MVSLETDVEAEARVTGPWVDARVSGTLIHDPGEPLPTMPGGVLLLVGAFADEPATLPSLVEAAERGFVALILKRRGRDLGRLVEAADGAGLAVVVAADPVPWRHLDALISSALATGAHEEGGPEEAGGGELFSIANAVAAVVGGSVAIEDLSQHVLAYSTIEGQRIDALRREGILDRRVPRGPRDAEMYREVMAGGGVVRFGQLGPDLPRAAVAIRAGTLPLGTLWAIEDEGGLTPQGERAVLEGAQLAALHILRARSALDLERQRRGELLRALLEEARSPESAWPRLGFASEEPVVLLGVAPAWSAKGSPSPPIDNVLRQVARVCAALRPEAAVTTSARSVYVLVAGRGSAAAAGRLARRLAADVTRALRAQVFTAISSERAGPLSIPELRHEVDRVLRVAAGGVSAPTVATLADVRTQVLLLHLRDELERHPELGQPELAALMRSERLAPLAASVLAWLDAGQSIPAAADRLQVHPNTLRYRLRRFRQLAAIDLDDPDQRLATWMELRLRAFS